MMMMMIMRQVPWAGGILGCLYNHVTDTCSSSEALDCYCTKQYIDCFREDGCLVPNSSFEAFCVQDRCSPEQVLLCIYSAMFTYRYVLNRLVGDNINVYV